MFVACTVNKVKPDLDLTMFNQTNIPSKLLLQCDPRILAIGWSITDGMFESLHAFFAIEIKECHKLDISKHAFRGMTSLKTLIIKGGNNAQIDRGSLQIPDLSNLEVVSITEGGLLKAPFMCGKENLWLVNLTGNSLIAFSDTGLVCDSPSNIQIIDISDNGIRDLPPRIRTITTNLNGLFASRNKISEIEPTVFETLTDIVELNLNENRIFHFPADFLGNNSRMQTLQLAYNIVGFLPNGIFSVMDSVLFLNLNGMELNDDIWRLLEYLTSLKILRLSDNNIKSFDTGVMRNLNQLQILEISDNIINEIPNRTFVNQMEMRLLNMTKNNITSIERDSFKGMQRLFKLDLSRNKISEVHSEALSDLNSLFLLNFSRNRIKILPKLPISLEFLDLRKNEIISLDKNNPLLGLKNLKELNLEYNNISFIPINAFKTNVKLQALQLAYNNISTIDYHMFPRDSPLDSLFLHHNVINDIPYYPNKYFPRLRVLDISHNKLNALVPGNFGQDALFPDNIEELFFAWNEIYLIENFVFQKPKLRFVDLRQNRIESLSNLALEVSDNNLMPVTYLLTGNHFFCDCRLQWMKDVDSLQSEFSHVRYVIRDINTLFCHALYRQEPRLMKYIPPTGFLCPYKEKCIDLFCQCCLFETCKCRAYCPAACDCYRARNWDDADIVDCLHANLTSIPSDITTTCTSLDLSGNNFSSISSSDFDGRDRIKKLYLHSSHIIELEDGCFKGLPSLLSLDLSYNLLRSLNARMFDGLNHLGNLSVSFNRISVIAEGTFASLKSLKQLDLTANELQTLSNHDFKLMSNILSLKLAKNPWTCECTYLEMMKNFTIAKASHITDIDKVVCITYNVTSNETVKYPLAGVHLPDFCLNKTVVYNETKTESEKLDSAAIAAMSTVLSVFVFGIVVFGIVFSKREFLKVWCFVKFGWKLYQKENEGDANRPYDAFVSYSSDDEDFVARKLVPYLEEDRKGRQGYRLCVHYRDFAVGASIAESIISAVERSKRVIIVLSENFLNSEWCQFEFQKAHHQLLEERKNRIIMIVLHDINNNMLDQQLKDYLKTRTYVKYGDPWFWAKVEYAMPKLTQPPEQDNTVQPRVVPNIYIQREMSTGSGDIVNDDMQYILDNMKNLEVDDPKQFAFEIDIEQ